MTTRALEQIDDIAAHYDAALEAAREGGYLEGTADVDDRVTWATFHGFVCGVVAGAGGLLILQFVDRWVR